MFYSVVANQRQTQYSYRQTGGAGGVARGNKGESIATVLAIDTVVHWYSSSSINTYCSNSLRWPEKARRRDGGRGEGNMLSIKKRVNRNDIRGYFAAGEKKKKVARPPSLAPSLPLVAGDNAREKNGKATTRQPTK